MSLSCSGRVDRDIRTRPAAIPDEDAAALARPRGELTRQRRGDRPGRRGDNHINAVEQGRDDVPEVGLSFEAWLSTLVSEVEAGRYREDPERGEFMRSRG